MGWLERHSEILDDLLDTKRRVREIKAEMKEAQEVPTERSMVPEERKDATSLLFGKNSIRKASNIANALSAIARKQGFSRTIDGRDYMTVEGWSTLGVMVGVSASVAEVRELPERKVQLLLVKEKFFDTYKKQYSTRTRFIRPETFEAEKHEAIPDVDGKNIREVSEIRYVARVALKTASGDTLSVGEAICSNLESGKIGKDEYVICSMAQTRATGKAFRLLLSWIVKLAGFEGTPAEEIESDNTSEPPTIKVDGGGIEETPQGRA